MIILNKILEAWHTNKSDAIAIISTTIAFTLWTAFTLYLAITSLLTGISKTDLVINLMPVLVSVLLFACVRTVWNVSHTHDMVMKLPQPTVNVQRHDDTDAILRFLDSFKSGHASAKIFVGFPDPHLIEGLVALLKTSAAKHFHLYVHPGTLQMFLDAGLFSPRDSTTPVRNSMQESSEPSIYVIDCPRESCLVFARETTVLNCLTARYLPSDGACWTAEIQKDSQFAINLEDTFNQYYQSQAVAVQVYLREVSKARFLEKAHEVERDRIATFIETGTRHFASRQRGYQFATHLLKHAHQAVFAVDFMPPEKWNDLRVYEEAHLLLKRRGVTVERIHLYKPENLIAHQETLNEYVKRQNVLGVKLYFLSSAHAEGLLRRGSTGFAVIDRQMVYAVEEDSDRRECARIDFDPDCVNDYIIKFDELKGMNPVLITNKEDHDNLIKRI